MMLRRGRHAKIRKDLQKGEHLLVLLRNVDVVERDDLAGHFFPRGQPNLAPRTMTATLNRRKPDSPHSRTPQHDQQVKTCWISGSKLEVIS
jgi:hypothetical protein